MSYRAKQFYSSICEASSAVRSLKPRPEGAVEYLELYKADPKLPSNPDKEYEGDWKGWKEFLGTNKGVSKKYYQTIEEAIEAVKTIGGINSARTYKSRRALDKKLHSNPNVLYKDSWTGWEDFTNPSHQPFKLCA